MKNSPKVKSLMGTKFLFDEDTISYKDLVELMEKTGIFDTRFIQKPIKDKSGVHSLYIKLDFEVAYLGKSTSADDYYETAEYYNTPEHEYANYRETTLLDFLEDLDLLEYIKYGSEENEISQEELVEKKPTKPTKFQKEIKQNKSKFVTFEYDGVIVSYKKKIIKSLLYIKEREELYINRTLERVVDKRVVDIKLSNVDSHLYNHIMSQL